MRVLIADDHPLIRKGLKLTLSDAAAISRVDEASDGAELLERMRGARYDVVVLDLSMPGRDGLEVLKDLRSLHPDTPVIILSLQPEEQYAARAFRAGASACLNKSAAPEVLLEAIRQVTAGVPYISPQAGRRLLEEVRGGSSELPHQALSDREHQVFLLIASGLTSGQISEKLNLSVKTVSTYRTRLLEKMSMQTNAQLIRYAFQHGLIR
jgi:two-component system, NarL family, invasion response regulator UvrY